MMWFFAVLVVLALGAVAVVASGHGTPMAPNHPDRPDVTVPADRPLAGIDLRRIRFGTAVRGYRMDEVDALLGRLSRQLDDAARPFEEPPADVPAAAGTGGADGDEPTE